LGNLNNSDIFENLSVHRKKQSKNDLRKFWWGVFYCISVAEGKGY
jgi:hypothetical protein